MSYPNKPDRLAASSGDAPRVTVVICTYSIDRWDSLQRAVAAVVSQQPPAAELIIIIDHSPEVEVLAGELSDARVIVNRGPRGLSAARNTGISAATGDIVAFLDDDASPDPDWLQSLVAHFQHPEVLGVGGRALPLWSGRRPAWFPREFDWVVGCSYRGLPSEASPIRNLIGCNMAFRRSLFGEIGGFRHDFGRIGTLPVGCEETELCIRATTRHPGRRFMYEPIATVRHEVPRQRMTWRYFASRCYREGTSKALVARVAGSSVGLSSERHHALVTLPRGLLSAVRDSFVHRDTAPLGRGFAIIAGLMLTAAGYARGRFALPRTGLGPPPQVTLADDGRG